jgi:HSP20 family protein
MGRGWDPLRDLVVLQDRMNRLFEEAAERRSRGGGGGETEQERDIEHVDWTPAADVYDREQEYLIAVDVPGIERESLDISLDNESLSIRGARNVDEDGQQRRERPHGRFLRKYGPLPPTVDQDAIRAEYKDGVLLVHLPKRKVEPSRRVEIKVS